MPLGFADLHCHQFANLGFGGREFWGGAYGDIAKELSWCSPAHGLFGEKDIVSNALKLAYEYPFGIGHHVGGYPKFDGWPRWDSITHQAVYESWLRQAVDGGLRLLVMLAVNNEYMCNLLPIDVRQPGRTCNDMEAVDLQIEAAYSMQAYIDESSGGPGQGWYRVCTDPETARRVIAEGKLAVIIGIEVDYLFNCRNEDDLTPVELDAILDDYLARGVRHIFPIHFGDNGFGGAAFQNPLNYDSTSGGFRNPSQFYVMETEDGTPWGYELGEGRRNVRGLTGLGMHLIRGMISRGMIIDIDHMSARSKADTLDLCEAANYSGVVCGHAGFVEISKGDKRHEGQLTAAELERVRRLGGMIAPIVNQGVLKDIETWRGPGQPVVDHVSGRTSNTMVQAYLYAVSKTRGAPVGIGTDFNGFAGLPGPRFGADRPKGTDPNNPVAYPFISPITGQPVDRYATGERTWDFNVDGLAHIGLLPDLIADFQAMGLGPAELDPLLRSAEGYLSMWSGSSSREQEILLLLSGTVSHSGRLREFEESLILQSGSSTAFGRADQSEQSLLF